jgi:Sec-independent protein translocase protein TatA
MGVIRGISVVILSSLLFLSLFSTVLFLNFSQALNYESLEKNSVGFVKEIIKNNTDFDETLSENMQFMEIYCNENKSASYSFNLLNYSLNVPCKENLSVDYILEEGIKDLEQEIYFKEYECGFIDCFEQEELPLFLISQKTYSLLNKYFYISLLISLIFILCLFFLLDKKSNLFILSGVLLLIPSILFSYLSKIHSFFNEQMISQAIKILFINSYSISLKFIILAIVLIFVGIIVKIFKLGFLISNFISKFKKNDSDKEIIKQDKNKPEKNNTSSKKDINFSEENNKSSSKK